MDEDSSSGTDAARSRSEERLDFEAQSRLASVRQALFGLTPQPLRIDRFMLMEPLGAGGMGIVYAAHDPRLERKIALKIVKPELAVSLRDEARLLREAQAMARLSHPNVVQIYEVGMADGRLFIAMELVPGRTLAGWLATPGRNWREIVGVFVEAGRGLAAAHVAGIVHRDFKPENVLCGADGRVRVTDFGLARGGTTTERSGSNDPIGGMPGLGAASLTTSGAIAGTPYYMAPELFLARPANAASDQFSFCVALYHALHGVRPFTGEDRAALMRAVLAGQRQEPPRIRFPRRIHRALVRGLSTAPEERFPDMGALLDAIGPVSPWRRAGLVALGVTLGAALLGGAGLLGVFGASVCMPSSARFDVATGAEPYRVPAGCREIRVQAWGAGGGGAMYPGGGGGYAEAVLAVEPGQELSVAVGGGGGSWANGAYHDATGGSPGGSGGYAGASSGGLSGAREGIVWLLVAGGGGGAGASGGGGGGGGSQGQDGGPYSSLQGHGGTPLAGGAGGLSLFDAVAGKDGSGTRGGIGGASPRQLIGDATIGVGGGAGGGGMWAGGGGGGDGRGLSQGGLSGGGGGGSGYVAPTRALSGTIVLLEAEHQEQANAGASEGAGRGGDGRVPGRSEATSGQPGLVYITTGAS